MWFFESIIIFKKSHGWSGRVPWLLGEDKNCHGYYDMRIIEWPPKTMSGPTKSCCRILANQVQKCLNLAIWNPEKQKICYQFEKKTFTNAKFGNQNNFFKMLLVTVNKSNTRPTLAHTKLHTTTHTCSWLCEELIILSLSP
jgi:hypothetical protein